MNKDELLAHLEEQGFVFRDQNDSYSLSSNLLISSMPISLGFESVSITQNKNLCKSRLDTNINSEFVRGMNLRVPLIAANMSSVIDAEFYIQLYKLGALGILHRAKKEEEMIADVMQVSKECEYVATSIGVGEDQYRVVKNLIHFGANIITIDIAHGYSDEVINLGRKIKTNYPHVKLIIGNTINTSIMEEVADFADAVKIGVGQGMACETKNTAACTEKQFSAVLKFKHLSKKLGLPTISDGGIREPADFVKAVAAGSNSVMAGSIFARCPESAAAIIEINDVKKKVYFGMSSRRAQDTWKNGLKKGTCPEGKTTYLDIGESIDSLIERYSGALRSGITYAGATDINSFQENVQFVRLV
jgi:IMP dehydrogenase/GMP reductase